MLTDEQRDALVEDLRSHDAAFASLRKWAEPILETLRHADEMRDGILERHGVDGEILYCEGGCLILPGDKYHTCSDGPYLCEQCAPTYRDCLRQMRERQADPEDMSNMDVQEAEELAESIARLEHMSDAELDQKNVSQYVP